MFSEYDLVALGAYGIIAIVLLIIVLILLISIPINLSKIKEQQKETNKTLLAILNQQDQIIKTIENKNVI